MLKVQEEIERGKRATTWEDIRHARLLIPIVHFLYNNNNNNNNNWRCLISLKKRKRTNRNKVEEINILCQTPFFP